MNKTLIIFISLFICNACATSGMNPKKLLGKRDEDYNFSDKNGTFLVKVNNGLDKKGKVYFTKRSMEILGDQKEKLLEKSIALADIGSVKGQNVLRPKKSQYTVWFEGKKYTSELTLIPEKKSIEVKMKSPEVQWSGTKSLSFPKSKALPCFFTQVIECAEVAGFLATVEKKEKASLNLLIVWEGYPYLNETLSDFPSELFSNAQLEYDGKTKESERRFNLKVAGQSIFYVLNEKNKMTKMFWITQGISMVGKSAQTSSTAAEDPDFE